MTHPFELTALQLQDRLDEMVEVTFGDLQSQFLTLPRGAGFIDYADFQTAYEGPISDIQRRQGVTVQCLRRGNNYVWVSATTVTRSREGGTVNYVRDYAGALELLK